MDDGLLTEREASALTGLTCSTLQTYRRDNRGPAFIKIGRAVRYARRDLIEYIRTKRD